MWEKLYDATILIIYNFEMCFLLILNLEVIWNRK